MLCIITVTAATGDSPIADAAMRGDREAVRVLLKHADVNQSQPDGMTALHWAASRDDVTMARLLIDARANVRVMLRRGSKVGATPAA